MGHPQSRTMEDVEEEQRELLKRLSTFQKSTFTCRSVYYGCYKSKKVTAAGAAAFGYFFDVSSFDPQQQQQQHEN